MKRILIVFSVALNIGFVMAAILTYYYHPSGLLARYSTHVQKIMKRLDLPPQQNQDLATHIDQFKEQFGSNLEALRRARTDMLMALAAPGPLDRNQFDEAYTQLDLLSKQEHQLVRNHLLMMRKQLGNEKGAHLFSEMLAKNK
jgi:hypothetical protein